MNDCEIVSENEPNSVNEVVKYQEHCSGGSTFTLTCSRLGTFIISLLKSYSRALLKKFWCKIKLICEPLEEMIHLTLEFYDGRIGLGEYIQKMFPHIENLQRIYYQELMNMTEVFCCFIYDIYYNSHIIPIGNNEEIFQPSLDYYERNNNNVEITDSTRNNNWQIIILDIVKNICINNVENRKWSSFITDFHKALTFFTNKLEELLLLRFNQSYTLNKEIMDENKANVMASILGKMYEDDFYPEKEFFDSVLSDVEEECRKFMNPSSTCLYPEDIEFNTTVYNNLITIFIKMLKTSNHGIHETVKTLCKISEEIMISLIEKLEEITEKAKTVYSKNVEVLKSDSIVRKMLKSIELPIESSDVVQAALRDLNYL